MSPRRPGNAPSDRPVVYHVARTRPRWPPVVLAVLALPALVGAQVVVAAVAPDPGTAVVAVPDPAGPTGPAPALLPAPSAAPDDLVVVDEVTVRFAVGAVLDEAALDALAPAAAVLAAPDAAPVLLLGSAEPGPDEDAARRLAQERADAVRQALLDAGAAEQLLRTRAVVDADQGRAVVVRTDVP